MSAIESIVEDLKRLPPERIEEVAVYIRKLQERAVAERLEILRRTSGCITAAEADEWEKAIEDCERIDETGW